MDTDQIAGDSLSNPLSIKSTSILERLSEVHEDIRQVYLSNNFPWVIGFSGGKDSTTALQLIWYALSELPPEQRTKPIYVIASDTLVETPVIVDHINTTLDRINATAKVEGLPMVAQKVTPTVDESFWVNLIGRGYPAPSAKFRWCTERLKIKPANRFILDRVAEHGEVVMVLGVRRSESATRAQVMSLHRIAGHRLSRHSSLPRAWVYTPIEDFEVDEVWTYLLQVPSPWGSNNRDLASLYQSAQSGECPLVIDTTTPSCGNSRFGCWVCTVVEKDHTMESLIDNGEEWMEPLLEVRELLAATHDPARKEVVREHRRRNGHVTIVDGKLIRGTYKLDFCKDLLRRVLQAQQRARVEGPDPSISLISEEELKEIRHLWRTERYDWEDSLPTIYNEVTRNHLEWLEDDSVSFAAPERALLEELCKDQEVPAELIMKLLETERQMQSMSRRSGIFAKIDTILGEDWRPEEMVLAEVKRKPIALSVLPSSRRMD